MRKCTGKARQVAADKCQELAHAQDMAPHTQRRIREQQRLRRSSVLTHQDTCIKNIHTVCQSAKFGQFLGLVHAACKKKFISDINAEKTLAAAVQYDLARNGVCTEM